LFRGTDLKRWKYAPGQGISVFKENTNAANGITRDPQGRRVACEAATRRVTGEERDRSMTVIASGFQGRRLNFPNDIVVKSDGAIYFTSVAPLNRGGSLRSLALPGNASCRCALGPSARGLAVSI
jgi:sugar lactone lactonase YvrE